jgi:hypothetical protein
MLGSGIPGQLIFVNKYAFMDVKKLIYCSSYQNKHPRFSKRLPKKHIKHSTTKPENDVQAIKEHQELTKMLGEDAIASLYLI